MLLIFYCDIYSQFCNLCVLAYASKLLDAVAEANAEWPPNTFYFLSPGPFPSVLRDSDWILGVTFP